MLGFALVVVGVFFGVVAYGVFHDHKDFQTSFGDSLPIYPKAPAEVFGKQRIYVMLLGIDYNYDDKGNPYSKDARSDTIMIAGLDFPTKSMKLVSVLRDTAAVVGGRETKINEAYSLGGVKLADAVVGEFLGMPANAKGRHFDRYVVVNVNGVKEVVDAIGGIDVDTGDENLDYDDNWGHTHIHFKKNRRYHMNGEQAQGYMRFRYDACSDPCRTKRQQQIIHIVIQKLKNDKLNDLLHIGQLISVVNRNVITNMNDTEKKSLAWAFHDANLADLAHADTIGYVDTKSTAAGDLTVGPALVAQPLLDQTLKRIDSKLQRRSDDTRPLF